MPLFPGYPGTIVLFNAPTVFLHEAGLVQIELGGGGIQGFGRGVGPFFRFQPLHHHLNESGRFGRLKAAMVGELEKRLTVEIGFSLLFDKRL